MTLKTLSGRGELAPPPAALLLHCHVLFATDDDRLDRWFWSFVVGGNQRFGLRRGCCDGSRLRRCLLLHCLGFGLGRWGGNDGWRCGLLGLLHDIEDVERLAAERIGRRGAGVDRRQIGLIGAGGGMRRDLGLAVWPAATTTTAASAAIAIIVGTGFGMLRHALDVFLGQLSVANLRRRLFWRGDGRRRNFVATAATAPAATTAAAVLSLFRGFAGDGAARLGRIVGILFVLADDFLVRLGLDD